jgi:ribonuclease HI
LSKTPKSFPSYLLKVVAAMSNQRLSDQVPSNPPTFTMTNEIWKDIMDLTPVPLPENPQLDVPALSRPIDLFAVKSNRCTLPGYRFIRINDQSQMLMFVDGACSGNGEQNARAGWAVCVGPNIVVKGRLEPAAVGSSGGQTNNRAELRSAIVALGLRYWKGEGFKSVVIASDSEYVVKGYCERLTTWKRRGWKTARGTDVINKDLWEALDEEIQSLAKAGVQVLFWRIPRELNEADQYAKQAAVSISRCRLDLFSLTTQRRQALELEGSLTSSTKVHMVGR